MKSLDRRGTDVEPHHLRGNFSDSLAGSTGFRSRRDDMVGRQHNANALALRERQKLARKLDLVFFDP